MLRVIVDIRARKSPPSLQHRPLTLRNVVYVLTTPPMKPLITYWKNVLFQTKCGMSWQAVRSSFVENTTLYKFYTDHHG
ncbi:unnamed protein product [Ambrosiozyma monospora]|uniref:Unnamed protein product n=1 Tax=Ambrosiozyma monospora TaxID=43982 RepID=A0A9W6Z5P2_AMBMO|nr:unnamed protein product [Ambrosiozyma monospora]